jgi:hypothetical protein
MVLLLLLLLRCWAWQGQEGECSRVGNVTKLTPLQQLSVMQGDICWLRMAIHAHLHASHHETLALPWCCCCCLLLGLVSLQPARLVVAGAAEALSLGCWEFKETLCKHYWQVQIDHQVQQQFQESQVC